ELILNASTHMQSVGSVVVGIDHIALAAVRCTGQASGIAGLITGLKRRWRVDSLKRRRPAVLRQIVVVEADAGSNDQVFNPVGRISNAQPWCEGFAVILGC